LTPTSVSATALPFSNETDEDCSDDPGWDAAVKRPFSLEKMLASLSTSSEAGLAKRLRLANSLNSDGRVLYFYGLGVGLASCADDHNLYKYEISLLSRYQKEFSTNTLTRFLKDYTISKSCGASWNQIRLQENFNLIHVKALLVNLLNGFRDLTLMGVEAFDFNHLNNVLVSRDHRTVRLIDIDGDSKGSIHYPSKLEPNVSQVPHKPCLDIDLNSLLPLIVRQLILGKGRGPAFITNKIGEIWRAKCSEEGKEIIRIILQENFYPRFKEEDDETIKKIEKHTRRVSEWFYALLKKKEPWTNWTNDIYDAMRCIDHLPIA